MDTIMKLALDTVMWTRALKWTETGRTFLQVAANPADEAAQFHAVERLLDEIIVASDLVYGPEQAKVNPIARAKQYSRLTSNGRRV